MSNKSLQHVIIKKDGFYGYYWDGDDRNYFEKKLEDMNILRYISNSCEIEDDVVLKDIANTVHSNLLLESFIGFNAHAAPWIAEINELIIESDYDYKNDEWLKTHEYLEIYWDSGLQQYEGKKDFHSVACFHAKGFKGFWDIGDGLELSKDPEWQQSYGISFTPVEQYANMPIKLNKSIICYWTNLDKYKIDKSIFENLDSMDDDNLFEDIESPIEEDEEKVIFEGFQGYSLLQVLTAIYYELTFHGGPSDREEFKEKIENSMDEFERLKEDNKIVPFIEGDKSKGQYDVVLSDQVRDFLGLPSNEEQFDLEIKRSANDEL